MVTTLPTLTVPVTGSVVEVDTYVCTGCGRDVTDTEPVMGKVIEVAMYVDHGVVPWVAVIVPLLTLTVPVIGNVTLVLM